MKYILFDLDGTIIDTLEGLKNAVNHALISFNHPTRTRNEIRLFIGNGVRKLLQRSFPEGTSQEELDIGYEKFVNYYENNFIKESIPYNGMLELLTKLKEKYTLAVVSNKDDLFANELVEHYFPGVFKVIQGTYFDKPKKPDPYIANLCLQKLNAKAEECLLVGDTPVDVKTATNSNLNCILVTYGFRTRDELNELVKDVTMVDSISELEEKIKAIR